MLSGSADRDDGQVQDDGEQVCVLTEPWGEKKKIFFNLKMEISYFYFTVKF